MEQLELESETDTKEEVHSEFEEKPKLRSLTSLTWPYVPEESAYPDPLKRDDPKPLQLDQYEAIGTFEPVLSHALSPEYLIYVGLAADEGH